MFCNSSADWLITQYINTTLNNGMRANEVKVNIDCTNGCPTAGLNLWYYSTNDAMLDRGTSERTLNFTQIGSVVDGENRVSGLTSMDGFYLAIQASSSSVCVTIERIYIIPSVCSEMTTNLVTFPESYAVNSPVIGQCSNNSEKSGSETLYATCEINGEWSTTSSCVCSAGYFLDSGVCSGNYNHCMRVQWHYSKHPDVQHISIIKRTPVHLFHVCSLSYGYL